MIEWMKERWEWILGAAVALLAFALGRRGKIQAEEMAEDIAETKEKELTVEREISAEEKLKLAQAHQKYVNSRIALRKQYRNAQSELERETANRKLELIEAAKEDPEAIDRILLEEFNIEKLKMETK